MIVALFLGHAIYKQKFQQSGESKSKQMAASNSPKAIPSGFTSEERDVLKSPPQNAPQADIDKHFALASKLSKESDTLDIANCRSNPLVLRIGLNKNLKIVNNENIDHRLIFDEDHQYKISKNNTTTVKTDFGRGPGLYGYVCEGVGLTGFILVTTP